MKSLDKNTLFSIFEAGDEEIYKEYDMEGVLENPYVLMGMVLSGIQNFELMNLMFSRNFPKEYKNVSHKIKYKYYCKLFGYLTRIDLNRLEEIYTIGESYPKQDVFEGLDELRVYFESLEQYEKCSTIKQYQDHLIYN